MKKKFVSVLFFFFFWCCCFFFFFKKKFPPSKWWFWAFRLHFLWYEQVDESRLEWIGRNFLCPESTVNESMCHTSARWNRFNLSSFAYPVTIHHRGDSFNAFQPPSLWQPRWLLLNRWQRQRPHFELGTITDVMGVTGRNNEPTIVADWNENWNGNGNDLTKRNNGSSVET